MRPLEDIATEAREAAFQIRQILRDQGFDDLARGVEAILGELDAAPEEISREEALRNAGTSYTSMAGGPGSLSDAVLWVDGDPDETARLNEEYRDLRNRLRQLLLEPRTVDSEDPPGERS